MADIAAVLQCLFQARFSGRYLQAQNLGARRVGSCRGFESEILRDFSSCLNTVRPRSLRTSVERIQWSRLGYLSVGFLRISRKMTLGSISPRTKALLMQNLFQTGELGMWATKPLRMLQRPSNILTGLSYECQELESRLQDLSVTFDHPVTRE